MDRQDSWKRTEEAEIDLTDLLKKLCTHWKQMAVCAIVFAVILGGYAWMNNAAGSGGEVSVTEETSVMTQAEEQAVADAVRLEGEIRGLERYLDSSILMQLDPYHRNRFIMLYRIDLAKRQELQGITESYLNFISNGGAADELGKAESGKNIDKSSLAELISAYQKTYSYPYQVSVDAGTDSSSLAESLFYIEITGENAASAEKMALDLKEVLKAYTADVKETAGSHRLSLVSSVQSMTSDSGLQTLQHDKKALLSSNLTSLRTMTDAFNELQTQAYQKAAGVEETGSPGEAEQGLEEVQTEGNSGFFIKYLFLGLAGGIFIYCGIFSFWYFFSDTVKSEKEMKGTYTFPFYGGIFPEEQAGKDRRSLPGLQQHDCGHRKAQVLNRIRMACKKRDITRLCAVSDFPFAAWEKECLKSMADQLKGWGIDMAVYENASMNTAVWDELEEKGNVLMVCRTGTTTHRMIDDEMSFYLENGITVMGAAAFLQNG